MKPSDMLHKMCGLVLAGTDIKALCKARGLPSQATSSRSVLETLFLSPQGVTNVFNSLDRHEIALLHLLKNSDSPERLINVSKMSSRKSNKGLSAAECCCWLNRGKTRGTKKQKSNAGDLHCPPNFTFTCRH